MARCGSTYAGVFRYEPRTEKLSVFVSYPFANPWGHVIDRWGQNFISDASNGDNYYGTAFSGHVDYPRKQRSMKEWTLTQRPPDRRQRVRRSRHFPDAAQGNFLYQQHHRLPGHQAVPTVGGRLRVRRRRDRAAAAVDRSELPARWRLQFGPDGALYVVDWFNPLIGHMQYSLRDPRRDKSRGRVWRITAKGRPLLDAAAASTGATDRGQQLDLLKAYEDRTRY